VLRVIDAHTTTLKHRPSDSQTHEAAVMCAVTTPSSAAQAAIPARRKSALEGALVAVVASVFIGCRGLDPDQAPA